MMVRGLTSPPLVSMDVHATLLGFSLRLLSRRIQHKLVDKPRKTETPFLRRCYWSRMRQQLLIPEARYGYKMNIILTHSLNTPLGTVLCNFQVRSNATIQLNSTPTPSPWHFSPSGNIKVVCSRCSIVAEMCLLNGNPSYARLLTSYVEALSLHAIH